MISKKEKKVIIISIISLILVAAIAISAIFIIRKKKNNDESLISSNMSQVDTNSSNLAIFNGDVSTNYNGTYKFNTIKDIELSDKLTKQEINALYKNKNISNENEFVSFI